MKATSILILILSLTFVVGQAQGASDTAAYPPAVTKALELAGDNRAPLEKVLAHYAATGDSLKLRAAYFLIGNMEGKSYVIFALKDTTGGEVNFDIMSYPNLATLEASFDTLQKAHGSLDFEKKETIKDLNVITADLLISQIDYAFRAWREKPWAKWFSFGQFCEYVLPYRGSSEPLENWREIFWQKYQSIPSGMADSTSPLMAASLINNDIMTWFGFDERYYYHPTDQGLSEMMASHKGRCEDMTNLAIFAMRANGLAVTSDYTPYWANSGNNHAWNAIIMPDGKAIPFMGDEANPGQYRLANKAAKVYRKMFAKQPETLAAQPHKQTKIPAWLSGESYKDVTSEYGEVCDVTVALDKGTPDSVDIAYLCVFNDGEWKPIQWGKIKNGVVIFPAMSKEIAYLPALYLNEKVKPFGAPFILRGDCTLQGLQPIDPPTAPVSLISTTARKQEVSTDGIARTALSPGKEYELFYWKNEWQSLGKAISGDKPLNFEKVPSGYLYRLVATDSDSGERIFTIKDGLQVWW